MPTFKNVSPEPLEVPRATGPVWVQPGEEFLGAADVLAPLVASGHLEPVPSPEPVPLPEPEPGKRRGRKAEAGAGVSDIDHIDHV